MQCVKFNKNGQYALSGGNDRTIRLWNPSKGTQIKVYKGHSYEVLDLDVGADNSRIASCGEDKQPFLWDVSTGNVIRRFRGHASRINCIKFNADSSVLITGSYDRTVKIWDCKSNTYDPIQSLDEAKDSISSIYISGFEIVSASIDGCVRKYDIRAGRLSTDNVGCKIYYYVEFRLSLSTDPVTSVSLSHDENCILTSTLDSTLRLFDKNSGELLGTYKGHVNTNFKIDSCFTNSDAYVISGSENHSIYFWSLVETTMVHTLKGHTGTVCGLATSPVDHIGGVTPLLSSSTDGTVRYWVS